MELVTINQIASMLNISHVQANAIVKKHNFKVMNGEERKRGRLFDISDVIAYKQVRGKRARTLTRIEEFEKVCSLFV
jgi:hypothetical protein